ncbi:uncharacterized protein LOC120085628 isoform X1 [Benincasa hispida]|uniref:uncharacterized protein LOC120085628 isoform X1 n=1 Tax=Benincasa hispida TaxID=102211 RepID=UPI001901D1FC|nr:uncharacterized protein LOC120085628 isoform X1 [Benincasa hispida]XP_038897652.1 uncharacterized protein LOC120085628 isoform X1 [Benincasa hispida]
MIGMGDEEQKQRCYNNRFGSFGTIGGISGRSSSKKLKPKPKKVPQRGLGVAQLEKIRLEEQQKNDAAPAIFSSSSPLSPTKSSSYLSLPVPSFRQSNRSPSFLSPPPVNLSSSTSMFGPPLPVLNMDVKDSFTVPLVDQANSGGSETGLSAVTILEQGNAIKWQSSCEYYLEKENYGVDPGLAFRSNFDFPYETNPGGPSNELQRAQQNQAPSPLVNLSSTTSLSSGLNVQIEPPSNQSYCYGNYSTIWADKEEKLQMFGMNRLPRFSPDNPTEPMFDYNHSSFNVPNRSDDSTLHGNGSALSFREDHVRSLSAPSSLENIKDDDFNGNFLTLASLATCWTSCPSSSIVKCPPTYPLLQNLMDSDSELHPFQGGLKPVGLAKKQPFYSFLPPAEVKTGKETAISMNKCNGEVGERLDLDLKL